MNDSVREHLEMVRDLKKDPEEIMKHATANDLDVLHMAIGMVGEAGEVTELVKKDVFNKRQIPSIEMLKECGDVLFYMAGLLDSYGWSIEDALDQNVSKLRTRYPDGYSDAAAAAKADQQ